MKINVAKNAGFCFGVKRAVDIALHTAKREKTVYTYGQLIHNRHVIEKLCNLGVSPIEDLDDIQNPQGSIVIIRSHGAPKSVFTNLEEMGVEVINATCPYVERIHRKIESTNSPVIIVGERQHPEVIGSMGYANQGCYVINCLEDIEELPHLHEPLVVAQTTITNEKWENLTRALSAKVQGANYYKSICDTTQRRQDEMEHLSKISDICLVVGDTNSSNTRKLYDICKKHCKNSFIIDNISEVSLEIISKGDIISITAGASTPEWLIREVTTLMSEQEKVFVENNDNENTNNELLQQPEVEGEQNATAEVSSDENDFLSQLDKSFVRLKRGQIVKGKVVQLTDDEACVSVGYKSDGIITKAELTLDGNVNPKDILKIGDEIDVEVLTLNDGKGNVLLSKKRIESKLKWQQFCDNADSETIYQCTVTGVVKGGLIGKTESYETFIPASQVAMRFVEDLNIFKGQTLDVVIKEADRRQKRIVASHRDVLVAEAQKKEAEVWSSFAKGDQITGKVKRLSDFGAFVDIGGVDGLLHIRDISWTPIKHPSEILKEEDEIEVVILNTSPEKKRISLGYKQLQPRPWDLAPEKYLVGEDVEGKVVRIVPFGAFVELEPGIDGLIHISQVSMRRIERVEDELRIGDVVNVRIMEVNPQKKKISLSRRAILNDEYMATMPEEEKVVKQKEEVDEKYVIPEVEELGVTLADFFPKMDE